MNEEQEPPTDEQSGSLRRKLVVGAAILGIGMYIRRRRSRNGESTTAASEDSTDTEPDTDAAIEAEPEPEQPSKRGGGIGRRLKMMVISTVVFALARWVVRRFRSSR